jgi:hypothetical protein
VNSDPHSSIDIVQAYLAGTLDLTATSDALLAAGMNPGISWGTEESSAEIQKKLEALFGRMLWRSLTRNQEEIPGGSTEDYRAFFIRMMGNRDTPGTTDGERG